MRERTLDRHRLPHLCGVLGTLGELCNRYGRFSPGPILDEHAGQHMQYARSAVVGNPGRTLERLWTCWANFGVAADMLDESQPWSGDGHAGRTLLWVWTPFELLSRYGSPVGLAWLLAALRHPPSSECSLIERLSVYR